MKARFVKELLNENFSYMKSKSDDLYHISELEKAEAELKAEGFNVQLGFEETHAGIDHYSISNASGDIILGYMPEGYMQTISDDDSWGFYVVENQSGDYESFENDILSALELFKNLLV